MKYPFRSKGFCFFLNPFKIHATFKVPLDCYAYCLLSVSGFSWILLLFNLLKFPMQRIDVLLLESISIPLLLISVDRIKYPWKVTRKARVRPKTKRQRSPGEGTERLHNFRTSSASVRYRTNEKFVGQPWWRSWRLVSSDYLFFLVSKYLITVLFKLFW